MSATMSAAGALTGPADLAGRAVRHAALAARQAPSVHNTQPWSFALGADSVDIRPDWTRRIDALDPRGRQLLLSCGCAVFNARVALAAAGLGVAVERTCDDDRPVAAARLRIDGGTTPDPVLAALEPSVAERHTNRRRYAYGGVDGATVELLTVAAAAEGAELREVAVPDDRLAVARLAGRLDRSDDARWPDLDGQGDDAAREFDTPSLRQTVFVLGTRADTPAAWERAGEALQRVWLELTRVGYVASPVTQLVEEPWTRARLQQELSLTIHPHILLRAGRIDATPATRRRRLSDLLVNAR